MRRRVSTTSSTSAKSSIVRGSDILCSGNDGVYDVSFFAASIRHTIGHSRSVFEKFSGKMLSELGDIWAGSTADEQQAYLLEHHEFAHHALMFSTPAGVLNWRLNQVISRDVQWILRKCRQYGIDIPAGVPPREVVSAPAWRLAFMRRADVDQGTKHELLRTISSLEDIIRLRRILFEPGAARTFADLTFGELQELLKRTHGYLGDRCDIRLCGDWRTRLPPDTKVFPEEKAFNLVDIAEVHAIAMELFVLRAVGDLDGLKTRAERARQGSYGAAVRAAMAATSAVNDLGFSPHQMQMMALIAFSASLDVSLKPTETVYLEEALPWWRFTSPEVFTPKTYIDALGNCLAIANTALVGPGSRWLQMAPGDWPLTGKPTEEKLSSFFMSLSSLGLDRQIHAIHQGAKLNWRYLATQFEMSANARHPHAFERLSPETWRAELQSAVLLVEYKDDLHFRHADYAELYPAGTPYRTSVKAIDSYGDPAYQLLGQILNGAIPRIMYAGYAGRLLPSLDVLEPKLAACLKSTKTATNAIFMLKTLIQGSMTVVEPYLTIAPASVAPDRYI
jgi:hypothetical protein